MTQQKHGSVNFSDIDTITQSVGALLDEFGQLYCELSNLGCISVSGEDASHFLQGQFSNDILQVNDRQGQLSAYCTPKGRALATMLIVRWQNMYWLILPQNLLGEILKRLQMFVLRSKVELTDQSEDYACIGAFHQTTTSPASVFSELPAEQDYACVTSENALSVKLPGTISRSLLLCTRSKAVTITGDDALFVDPALWAWSNVTAGVPVVESETQDAFTPQMINLDLINAVNFKKGCYPGQEVVARTHYLGKVKRRTHCFEYAGSTAVELNDKIIDASEQQIGSVVACVSPSESTTWLLAVIPVEQANNPLFLATDAKTALTPLPLPYSFSTEAP